MPIERTGVSVFNGLGLNFLTRDELDTIHSGACHILKHTGVLVEFEEAADRLHSAGAFVSRSGKNWLVKIPEWLVTESLASTPKSVTYFARDPEKDFLLENNRVGFGTFGEQVNIIDPITRKYRPSTKQDCCKVYRLIDALDELAFDYAKLIMDHECICHIRKLLEGVRVDNETMALDLIHEIGPGGTFLVHRHTLERTRSQSVVHLFDRGTREAWMETTGGKDLTERAYGKALEILESHQTQALPDGAAETINGLLDEFEARIKS